MKSPVGTPLSLMVSVCTLFALLLVGGCKSEEKGRTASLPPPLVGVMTVEERNVPVSFTYAGQTEGSRAVEVRAQVSGILMRRAYDEGQYVKQGQLLFEIEPDTYRAALRQANGVMEQAQAKFTQARQNLNRVLPLYKKNAVSQKDRDDAQAAYDSAKADLDSAKAAVSEAEIKLSHAYVTAPVAGFASREYRTVGNLITAGSQDGSLLTVVNQNDPIYANFAIPSPQFMRLRALQEQGRLKSDGTVAEITLADGTVYQTKGVITFIDKQVNTNTSVVAARAEFVNPDLFVLPGQFVRVTLSGMELVNAILIPQQAVIQTQKGSMVVVIGEGDKAEMRPVDLGDNYGDSFLLNKGVKAGERIVVEGGNKAVPGQPCGFSKPPFRTRSCRISPSAQAPIPARPNRGALWKTNKPRRRNRLPKSRKAFSSAVRSFPRLSRSSLRWWARSPFQCCPLNSIPT